MFATPVKQKESSPAVRRNSSAAAHPERAPDGATVQLSSLIRNANIQAKLKVGQPDDPYEQEADKIAEKVTATADKSAGTPDVCKTPTPITPVPIPYPNTGPVREANTSTQQVKISGKKVFSKATNLVKSSGDEAGHAVKAVVAQRKAKFTAVLPVSLQPPDKEKSSKAKQPEEEEAAVQPQLLQRQPEEEEEPVQAKPDLQRQEEEEEEVMQPQLLQRQPEEEEEEEVLQPKGRGDLQRQVPDAVAALLRSSKAGGTPLAPAVQAQMEGSFGVDFSAVRVHSDSDSTQMNRLIGAQAFTKGNHIYFNSGKYSPDSSKGQKLLAHELTHVVQQGAAEPKVAPQQQVQSMGAAKLPVAESSGRQVEATASESTEVNRTQAPRPVVGEKPVAASPNVQPEVGAVAGQDSTEGDRKQQSAASATAGEAVPVAGKQSKDAGVGGFLRKVTKATFAAKTAKVSRLASNEKKTESAATKLAQSEKSVVPPGDESQSRANFQQVATVDQLEQPKPDETKARQGLDRAMENAVPKSLEEVDQFKQEGKGREVGQAVNVLVTADSQEVKATYQQIENTPAAAPAEAAVELPALETAAATEPLNLGDGVVGEVTAEHTDLSEFQNEADNLMEKEGIKDEHLDMVDSGDLAEAKADRKEVKQTVKDGPKEVKALEQQQKQQVHQDLKHEELAGRRQMRAERNRQLLGSQGEQKKTKGKIEEKRQKVTEHINGIYALANSTVKQKLDDLEKKSLKDFDDGQASATSAFEENVNRRMNAFKNRRYDRIGGSLLWAKDKLFGMDELPAVKHIFDSEKASFIAAIDRLITTITAENKRVIQECRQLIATARVEIKKYVDSLGPELRKTGQEALQQMKGKLDALDKAVNDKEQALQQKLAEKREAAIKAIEEKIEKMKEAMSGLISKLGNLLLNAMLKFFEWALKKAGYASQQLMGIINKGKQVIKKIVTDPVGFIKNIIKAVKDGIGLFVTNIKKHLIAGMIAWLTGAMADVPITLPEKFDLKGILHLVLQILGLTWANIRVKLVKRLGEKVVSVAEKTVDIVKRVIKDGPMALWEMLKEKAVEIKQQVMDGIRSWLITQVVKQAIIKLLSFLNPAGAIIQAILAIYNTIMFFVENWQRIVTFVKTVFSSIVDIAMGKLSAASQAVEKAMAMTIPIILNFLARLLGLSGIGKAVANIIKKIRKPIDKIVNKVIDSVVTLAKKLFKKGQAGAKALKEKGLAAILWWKQRLSFKTKAGKAHTLFFKGKGPSAKFMIASTEQSIETYLANIKLAAGDPRATALAQAKKLVGEIRVITRSDTKKDPVDSKEAKQVTDKVTQLSKLLMVLEQAGLAALPTKANWSWTGGAGKSAKVELLSTKTSTGGSDPSGSTPEFDFLRSRGMTNAGDKWVRMHLINEKVGGTGAPKNWVPAPNSVNTGGKVMSFETAMKNLVEKKATRNLPNVVWAKSSVTSTHPAKPQWDNLPHFPDRVTFRAGLHYLKDGTWAKDSSARISEDVKVPQPKAGEIPSLSNPSHTVLSALDKAAFTSGTVQKIRTEAQSKRGDYASRASFIKRMTENVEPSNPRWQKKIPILKSAVDQLYEAGKIKLK